MRKCKCGKPLQATGEWRRRVRSGRRFGAVLEVRLQCECGKGVWDSSKKARRYAQPSGPWREVVAGAAQRSLLL